jgi:hypothetical protein
MCWATFWAIFSLTHLVTLVGSACELVQESFKGESVVGHRLTCGAVQPENFYGKTKKVSKVL